MNEYWRNKIEQKIADGVPEISRRLLQDLWPQLLRPFPAMTIVQFKPRLEQLQCGYNIKRGTELLSVPIDSMDDKSCKFTTTSRVTILPIQLQHLNVKTDTPGVIELELGFRVERGASIKNLTLSDFRFYLHQDNNEAISFYNLLTNEVVRVELEAEGVVVKLGGQEAIAPANIGLIETLLPNCVPSKWPYYLLQEYFLFRQKFMFVELKGISAEMFPANCAEFKIRVILNSSLPLANHISRDNFRLFCTPAVNLYPKSCEPIKVTGKKWCYPIAIDAENYDHESLYDFVKIKGARVIENNNIYYLFVEDEKLVGKVLSCRALLCNGDCPCQNLQIDAISIPGAGFPESIMFSNIVRPTRLFMPPNCKDYNWQLISQLNLHYRAIAKLSDLQELLLFYDWGDNKRKIVAINSYNSKVVTKMARGMLRQGLCYSLEIEESGFNSLSELQLFGLVLSKFFALTVMVNYFTELVITCLPSNKELRWSNL